VKIVPEFPDGYYWARHFDGTAFVVKRDGPCWHCCGVETPINPDFEAAKQIIKPIPVPVH
jgi:hypothetical protein